MDCPTKQHLSSAALPNSALGPPPHPTRSPPSLSIAADRTLAHARTGTEPWQAHVPIATAEASDNRSIGTPANRPSDDRNCGPQSPLAIPEILQEICYYLDRPALVHASRVCKRFWACASPLLWTHIPAHAWKNDHFCAHWHRHGSQITTLHCGPGTDLGRVSLYCRNLLLLDISRIQEPISAIVQEPAVAAKCRFRDSYDSFLQMTDELAQVIQANRDLRCLKLRPQGRFPPRLLLALSHLGQFEILSLDAWHDFQEYSLQLILEACPRLHHLSLGENDYTQFTLETLLEPVLLKPRSTGTNQDEKRFKLERFDDPIKGRNGHSNVDRDHFEIHSKRAVYASSSDQDLLDLSTAYPSLSVHHQNYPHLHAKEHRPSSILSNQIRTLSLHQTGLRQEFLINLTRQCPRLEHLSLLDGWGFYPSARFASILSESCPRLSRIEFREQALDLQDEFFVSLCHHLPRLEWIHAAATGFSRGALEAVRIHCKTIVSLNIDGARGIQSRALDELLRTCGSLKELRAQGVVLNGRDVCGGSRWACRGLEALTVDIEIYAAMTSNRVTATQPTSDSVEGVRRRVYEQLASLTRLRILGLGGGHSVGGKEAGVDLTLSSGLEALATLQCLERLDIKRMARTQSEEDLTWMVQHWPRFWFLEVSKGRVHSRGHDRTHKAIDWLSRSRPGIAISQF